MFKALSIHAWLILTLRHDGRGLPKDPEIVIQFLLASSVITSMVHGVAVGPTMFIVLGFFALIFGGRLATGAAILSAFADVVYLPMQALDLDQAGLFDIYQLLCLYVLFARLSVLRNK